MKVKWVNSLTKKKRSALLKHYDFKLMTSMEKTCTGRDIFEKLNDKLNELGLCWDNCVGVCTDGAASMLGKNKGLAALVREVALHVRFTHCMIHREALAAKTLPAELNAVLQTATQIVNFIKIRPTKSRLSGLLCKEMGSEYESLLLHMEVRWLSRGKVLQRIFSLRDELRMFLLDYGSSLAHFFTDAKWLTDLAYLSDIFDRLNTLNLSLQGPNSNLLTMSDKIVGFVRKLQRWRGQFDLGNLDMFPTLDEFLTENELMLQKKKSLSICKPCLHISISIFLSSIVGTSTTGFVTPSSKAQ